MDTTLVKKTKQWIKAHPWDTVLLLALGLVGLGTGLWASVIILDDALITFRVAANLAHGRGFVYNVGQRVQVTTAPLYAMVLAVGVWLFGSAPRAALVLNVSLSALIPMLAYDLGRRLAGRITGLAGALLLTLAPFLVMAFSMESYLYVALILASMVAYVAGHYRLAGVLVGITALVRGDAVLLGACLLTYDLLGRRRLLWQLITPAVVIPAGWYLFALFYYGSPFPATLGAKVAQGEFNWLGRRFLDGLLSYLYTWTIEQNYDALYLFLPLIAVGAFWAVWAERPWLILIAHNILYVIAFVVLAVPAAEWYYAPLMPAAALLTARGIQLVADGLAKFLTPLSRVANAPIVSTKLQTLVSGGVAALLVLTLLRTLYPITNAIVQQNPDWKARVYPDAGRWIAENTNASANFATIDIGHLGYWSGREIIDIVGLAQPKVAAHIAEGDFGYAIRHYRPDMVLIGYSWLPEVQSTAWFQADYVPRHYFKFRALDEPLLLFSRREGVKVQPNPIPPAAIRPLNVDFNRQITLTGYHLHQPLASGSPLNLTLFWKATAPVAVDFTVFVQLVDAENNIVAQRDSKPQNGFYGTTYWQPGELIIDLHSFPIPPDVPPGDYDLLLGLYEADAGLRLQILDEAGIFKNDHLRLSDIHVQAP